jgi:hypothetical protein
MADDQSTDTADLSLVYAVLGDDLVFMREHDAEQRTDAMQGDPPPETWGEVRQLGEPYPAWLYETMIDSIDPEFSSFEEFKASYLEDEDCEVTDEHLMAAYRALPVGRRLPFDDDPVDWEAFDFAGCNPFLGGHWFIWPAQEMLSWVPAAIQQRYGRREYHISGECLTLSAKDEAVIVAEFLAAGYGVKRDDDLVAGSMNTMPW